MTDSVKDALRKAGLVVPAAPAPPPAKKSDKWLHELPDDAKLPPLFDAPARTKVKPSTPVPGKKP